MEDKKHSLERQILIPVKRGFGIVTCLLFFVILGVVLEWWGRMDGGYGGGLYLYTELHTASLSFFGFVLYLILIIEKEGIWGFRVFWWNPFFCNVTGANMEIRKYIGHNFIILFRDIPFLLDAEKAHLSPFSHFWFLWWKKNHVMQEDWSPLPLRILTTHSNFVFCQHFIKFGFSIQHLTLPVRRGMRYVIDHNPQGKNSGSHIWVPSRLQQVPWSNLQEYIHFFDVLAKAHSHHTIESGSKRKIYYFYLTLPHLEFKLGRQYFKR